MSYQYTLTELLALKTFKQNHSFYQADINRMITEWASSELSKENSSEALMILASLGLDKKIDDYEFDYYLKLYLLDAKITIPSEAYAGLIWLRYYLQDLLKSCSFAELEAQLELARGEHLHLENGFFVRVKHMLRDDYYYIFDYWDEDNPPSFESVIVALDKKIKPVLKVLAHEEWLRVLV